MPNQLVFQMSQAYPFTACHKAQSVGGEVLILKEFNTGNKKELVSKARGLKKLKVPHTIQICSILESQDILQIYYEYVPVGFEVWMGNLSDQLFKNLYCQLHELSNFLAKNHIVVNLGVSRLGLSELYSAKYFIGLDYEQDLTRDAQSLKEKYHRQISKILEPELCASRIQTTPLYKSVNQKQFQGLKDVQKRATLNSPTKKMTRLNKMIKTQTTNEDDLVRPLKQWRKRQTSKVQIHEKLKAMKCKIESMKKADQEAILRSKQIYSRGYCRLQPRRASVDHMCSSRRVNQNEEKESKDLVQDSMGHSISCADLHNKSNNKAESEKFRSVKNSESPIEFSETAKTNEECFRNFMNVLENDNEEESFEMVSSGGVCPMTPQPDNKNAAKEKMRQVIEGSKRLIQRIKGKANKRV